MNKILIRILIISFVLSAVSCSAPGGNENTVVLMKTTLGNIRLRLYNETPIHRDNFISLVNSGFYDGISFHRVIKGFMIQAGDPSTRTVPIDKSADSLNTYTIPPEFNRQFCHKKGALAAAREGNDVNPDMRSSGTHFYIIQGVKLTDDQLNQADQIINNNIKRALFNKFIHNVADSAASSGTPLSDSDIQELASEKMFKYLVTEGNYKIPEVQRIAYKTIGGMPRLDGTYTVFGEVIDGLDVVDRIAAVDTDNADKPLSDIKILKIKILK
jgi:peptidylprolyl isomerase